MFGSEDTISRDGVHLIVSALGRPSYKLERTLFQLILGNKEKTRIETSVETENEIVHEARAGLNLPAELEMLLRISGSEVEESFKTGRAYPLILTKNVEHSSSISFATRPNQNLSIYVFKDQKVLGKVLEITVSFRTAKEAISVAVAGGDCLDVSIYLRQHEFDFLFRDCYISSKSPDLYLVIGVICYQGPAERAFAKEEDDKTILIEQDAIICADLRAVHSGKNFKCVSPKLSEVEQETVIADKPKARTEDRFEQALVRLEATQNKVATWLHRFFLAFLVIIGLILLKEIGVFQRHP